MGWDVGPCGVVCTDPYRSIGDIDEAMKLQYLASAAHATQWNGCQRVGDEGTYTACNGISSAPKFNANL
jgi:hypothetical protein